MSRPRIFAAAGIVLLVAVALCAGLWPRRGVVTVEVARISRKNLTSTVRATGEIRSLNYTNILAQGFGRITDIFVQEGQPVRAGDLLMQVESIQPAADVRAQQAALDSAQAAFRAAQANLHAAQATVAQRQADVDKARFDWEQGQKLLDAGVISRQNFAGLKSVFNGADAALLAAQAQLAQAGAQQAQALSNLGQTQAVLVHTKDVLRKTTYRAPIAGVVTYIAVRVGEDVIPGVEDAEGAYLMTISNLSDVVAEVRVEENAIVNVRDNQTAQVLIDVLPDQTFSGSVTEVGTQAVLRSSGLATSQTTSSNEEARDFKVDIMIDHPPPSLRPGMTAAAVIQTARKTNVVAVPFQALVLRPSSEAGRTSLPKIPPPAPVEIAANPAGKNYTVQGIQGVFVVRSGRAIFVPVEVGILGANDVEVVKGVDVGDLLILGNFSALRELHSGARVKIAKSGQPSV